MIWRRATAIPLALVLVVIGSLFAPPAKAQTPTYGAASVFGPVPTPGRPFGVLATADSVYAATSSGAAWEPSDGRDAVFRYGSDGGRPSETLGISTMPTMGLSDMAEDGEGRIYVVDMNGRILRLTPSPKGLIAEVYATDPLQALGWQASMWVGVAFDAIGDLFVTDASQGAIWKIPPSTPAKTQPIIWLQCPAFRTAQIAGVNGIRFGPDGDMYLVQGSTPMPDGPGGSVVFRLPMSSPPSCGELTTFHRFAVEPNSRPVPFPVASFLTFARSGHLYVTLAATNQVAELNSHGDLLHMISSTLFDIPIGIGFQGDSLLVTNSNYEPPSNPAHWQILKVFVSELGLPLSRPHLPG